jgi:hypothetical protein
MYRDFKKRYLQAQRELSPNHRGGAPALGAGEGDPVVKSVYVGLINAFEEGVKDCLVESPGLQRVVFTIYDQIVKILDRFYRTYYDRSPQFRARYQKLLRIYVDYYTIVLGRKPDQISPTTIFGTIQANGRVNLFDQIELLYKMSDLIFLICYIEWKVNQVSPNGGKAPFRPVEDDKTLGDLIASKKEDLDKRGSQAEKVALILQAVDNPGFGKKPISGTRAYIIKPSDKKSWLNDRGKYIYNYDQSKMDLGHLRRHVDGRVMRRYQRHISPLSVFQNRYEYLNRFDDASGAVPNTLFATPGVTTRTIYRSDGELDGDSRFYQHLQQYGMPHISGPSGSMHTFLSFYQMVEPEVVEQFNRYDSHPIDRRDLLRLVVLAFIGHIVTREDHSLYECLMGVPYTVVRQLRGGLGRNAKPEMTGLSELRDLLEFAHPDHPTVAEVRRHFLTCGPVDVTKLYDFETSQIDSRVAAKVAELADLIRP